jgi:pilus assembly protein CpaB
VKKVMGARVAAGLKANEPLLWTDLEKFNEHARVLSGLIENGMRAVVVDGKMVDFDGLLRPGDRVDVIFTAGDKDKGSPTSVTLLQNLLVLSTGGSIARVDDDAKARARSSSVSLSVTSEQAEKIMLATQQGKLMLSLRNPEDIAIVEGAPATTVKDLGAANPAATPLAREVVLEKERIDHVR